MKNKFSKSWESSKQPRKQRKFRANAPNHIKRKFMAAALDKPLREKYGRRSVEVKKGDDVKIMRGKFKGKHGKVGSVDVKNTRIQIEGAQRSKRGGEKVETWFHPSKVKIISLSENDKKRFKTKVETKKDETKEIKPEGKTEENKVKENKTGAKK